MINLLYNNQTNNNLITFTDLPNLLTVRDDEYDSGSKTIVQITLDNSLMSDTTYDGQWWIKVYENTVTNVLEPKNAKNKTFYIGSDAVSTTYSLVNALRQCPNVAANFNIELNDNKVLLTSRNNGDYLYSGWFSTNIDNSKCYTTTVQNGYVALDDTVINVDVTSNGEYITTLTKTAYEGETVFDVSPVLSTLAEYGQTKPYELAVSYFSANTTYAPIGTIGENYIVNGYMCNQSEKFFELPSLKVALNATRGASRDFLNNTILYTASPTIPISVYFGNAAGMTITYTYRDSAENVIYTTQSRWTKPWQSSKLFNFDLSFNHAGGAYFQQAYYLDLTLGSDTIRYNVIKPLRAYEDYHRLYWRNEYGGVQFVDLTASFSENHTSETTTYQKGIYDFYEADVNSLDKTFDIEVNNTYTAKSHLMEKDGIWSYNSLLQSKYVWTVINNQTYEIIIDSIDVEETTQNDIFQATVKYHLSQPTTLW